MTGKSMLIISVLAFAATSSLVVRVGGWGRSTVGAGAGAPGSVEERAWALLAEAEELCRAGTDGDLARENSSGSSASMGGALPAGLEVGAVVARRGIALEALDIAGELARSGLQEDAQAAILRTRNRLRASCSAPAGPGDSKAISWQSLDGRGSFDRISAVTPFLDRLNGAGVAASADPGALARAARPRPPSDPPAPLPVRSTPVRPVGAAVPEPPSKALAGVEAPALASIEITPASSDYRKRVRRWAAVFEREAGALRKGRAELQAEIAERSMAEARQACRSFGMALARLDPNLVETAPSRGIALRIERMVRQYWRGVAHCTSGRPAPAFSYLSEGDREWITIAEMAARIFEPRPLRRPRAPSPAESPVGARD